MFITFEGIDGCGKSTIISGIAELLRKKKIKVLLLREPGSTKVGEKIRKILLKYNMDKNTEALLYAASRRQLITEKIKPALKKNIIIICDRFIDSSLVYQGLVREIGIEQVLKINSIDNEEFPLPTITFLLDVSLQNAAKRINKRITEKHEKNDRFDSESLKFHDKVKKSFLKIAKMYKKRFVIIDANKDKKKIIEEIFNKIKSIL